MELLRRRYEESLPMLRGLFFTRLLDGRVARDRIMELAERYEVDLRGHTFAAAVVHMDKAREQGELPILSVQQLFEENLQLEGCRCQLFLYNESVALLAALGLCAAIVAVVDPFFHYRDPDPEAEVWFEERSQTAGLLRSQDYETLLMGTSLAANYRPLWFDAYFDTKTVKATLPNGGFHEFTQVLDYACETHEVKRVIFGLDPNILVRPIEEAPDQLPSYLYDSNPWNDGAYLLNKSVLVRALYTVKERAAGNTQSIQDAFVWDGSVFFSKELALAGYQRPEREETVLPVGAFLEDCEENLEVVKSWLERYPDTEFLFYYSPYSILFWDKMERQGRTDAMFAALEYATRELLAYDNVTIQCFLTDLDTITDLENYADHIHVAGRVTWRMSKAMAGTEHQLTVENYREKLDALRTYVVNYDYESIWADPAARETE